MITFHDGPAANESIDFPHAPDLLRVARNSLGVIRAMRYDDRPHYDEDIFVYRRVGHGTIMRKSLLQYGHVGHHATTTAIAEYALVKIQPHHRYTSERRAWESWCTAYRTLNSGRAAEGPDTHKGESDGEENRKRETQDRDRHSH